MKRKLQNIRENMGVIYFGHVWGNNLFVHTPVQTFGQLDLESGSPTSMKSPGLRSFLVARFLPGSWAADGTPLPYINCSSCTKSGCTTRLRIENYNFGP